MLLNWRLRLMIARLPASWGVSVLGGRIAAGRPPR